MDLLLTSEQEQLRAAARAFLASHGAPSADRAPGCDPASWLRSCRELGLAGLLAAGEWGGSDAGLREAALVMQEGGAVLDTSPLLSTSLAMAALRAVGETAGGAWVADAVDGRRRVALLLATRADRDTIVLTAASEKGPARVDARVSGVLDAVDADFFVVLGALADGRPGVGLVDADEPGVRRDPLSGLDLTRSFARVEITGAAAHVEAVSPPVMDDIRSRLDTLVAAELVGVIRHCVEALGAYVNTRVAFGRTIGSYQGVKHQLADMYCTFELADTAVRAAAAAIDDSEPDAALEAAVALHKATNSALDVTAESLRLYGGIGYTWEHDAHLYFRRARVDAVLLGRPEAQARRLAALLSV
ncbi:acyl-CoA dehydrogenase family protein [Pseudonocardia xishanensis]|uniref:Acyl-CoA dehydrogenase family protein n=1 Tax=Pseudonocardia xishanensis TaxID=630995 RepID=A0ABP8S0J8_9PSEU